MKLVEQALFTSTHTDREVGYQVTAGSVGVCAADARELAVWGPSRDALIDMGPEGESFNFHPLPSGSHCISRTTLAGCESDSWGQCLYTHCLIVPPEVLARFGNNPFALTRAASDQGVWLIRGVPCPRLEPLRLSGGATAVDETLLGQLAVDPGAESMAALVQSARNTICLAVAGVSSPAPLFAGLFSCLPTECRLEFSFSTGLKFSPRRPFRIVALSDDPAERLWVGNYANVTVLNLGASEESKVAPIDGWGQLVDRILSTGRIPFLATQLSKRRFDLTLDDLPALGLQLLEELDALVRGTGGHEVTPQKRPAKAERRSHAAHRQWEKSVQAGVVAAGPSISLAPSSPEVVDLLEHLDDLVYEAISGRTSALDELVTTWPRLLEKLSDDLLAESREQYLRYALSVWEECVEGGSVHNPERAIQALDVLCLLFGDATKL